MIKKIILFYYTQNFNYIYVVNKLRETELR